MYNDTGVSELIIYNKKIVLNIGVLILLSLLQINEGCGMSTVHLHKVVI